MANIEIITPETGISVPANNLILADKDHPFASIAQIGEENDVFEFDYVENMVAGADYLILDFKVQDYLDAKKYLELIEKANGKIGADDTTPFVDGNEYHFYTNNNFDIFGFIYSNTDLSITAQFSGTNQALLILGNTMFINTTNIFIPKNQYIPMRIINGNGYVKFYLYELSYDADGNNISTPTTKNIFFRPIV